VYVAVYQESREQSQRNHQKRPHITNRKEFIRFQQFYRLPLWLSTERDMLFAPCCGGAPKINFKPSSAIEDVWVSSATSISPKSNSFYPGGDMSPSRTEKNPGEYCQNHREPANGHWPSIIYVGIHLRRGYDTVVIGDITSHCVFLHNRSYKIYDEGFFRVTYKTIEGRILE
jgi:hypothetical protein